MMRGSGAELGTKTPAQDLAKSHHCSTVLTLLERGETLVPFRLERARAFPVPSRQSQPDGSQEGVRKSWKSTSRIRCKRDVFTMSANRTLSPDILESQLEVAMDRPSYFRGVDAQRHNRHALLISWFAALVLLSLVAVPGFAIRVPVRDGQTVNLKLRNVLTTDNVRRNDVIEFEVTEDVIVNGHVVIAKGSTARGKIVEVKGAYKPRAGDAEVVFEFSTVRAADKQELPLRLQPEKPRKGKAKEEVHERSAIPGQIMRVVGADKGKEYVAYVDGSYTVNTSDTIVVAPGAAPSAAPAAAQPSAPVAAVVAPATPAAPLATTDMAATSSVEFDSTPDGADIIIDGNLLGNTHSTLHLTVGHHDLEIRMAGYRTWSRRMVVDPESHQSVRVTLIPQ